MPLIVTGDPRCAGLARSISMARRLAARRVWMTSGVSSHDRPPSVIRIGLGAELWRKAIHRAMIFPSAIICHIQISKMLIAVSTSVLSSMSGGRNATVADAAKRSWL